MFNDGTIKDVPDIHPSTQRLYQAAKDLRDVTGLSAVARLLGATPQIVKNWESRGVSSDGALLAQKLIGCNANWLLEGVVQMRDTTWSPTPPDTQVGSIQPSASLYAFKAEPDWPFRTITKDEFAQISEFDRGQIEGFIKRLCQATQQQPKANGASS
jgi:hypothetical protein